MESSQKQTAAAGNGAQGRIVPFVYAACAGAPPQPGWQGWGEAESGTDVAAEPRRAAGGAQEMEQRLAEETRRAFEAGRERGRQEGRLAERDAQAAAHAAGEERRIRQAAELIESFAAQRGRYLESVEREVVQLALAVAARILRREAQMDPLLLTGAVRVALGQLSASTRVKLKVPPDELGLWTEAMALLPNLAQRPTVMAGEGMRLGDCVVETELGTVDLGVRAQLGEIERGFFDRAGSPKPSLAAPAGAGREMHA